MRRMNSGSVDLIYLDPPFNSKANYAAPIGSEAAGAEFKDTWYLDDIDKEWMQSIAKKHPKLHRVLLASSNDSDKAYLAYMSPRIIEMHRILKDTGSIYLHCDPTMSHYLKMAMDAIFGRENFRNEIIWSYKTGGRSKKWFGKKHDVILFYTKTNSYTFNLQKEKSYNRNGKPYRFEGVEEFEDENGQWYTMAGMRDVWEINAIGRTSKERTGYPTQKPEELLDRIIKTSSNEGDIVLDPFCGCATTLVVADVRSQPRQWVGIDISKKAAELVISRLEKAQKIYKDVKPRSDLPQRTDLGKLPPPRTYLSRLYGEQGGNCNGCGHHQPIKENFHVDHIIAKSKGGTDHIENLQLLCGNCNSIKGSRSMAYLKLARKRTKKILEIM